MDETSERSRGLAMVLAVCTGVFGGHRFYVGKIGSGLGMLFTLGGVGMWWLYDCILIGAGEFRDIDDRRLLRWESGAAGRAGIQSDEATRRVLESVEDMRSEMFELQERVDFLERMLAEVRQRQAVPPANPPDRARGH